MPQPKTPQSPKPRKPESDRDPLLDLLSDAPDASAPPPIAKAPIPAGLRGSAVPDLSGGYKPAAKYSDGVTLGGFGQNLLTSGANLGGSFAQTVMHPLEALKGVGDLALGTVALTGAGEQLFGKQEDPVLKQKNEDRKNLARAVGAHYKERLLNPVQTLYEDPVGAAGDVATAGTVVKGASLGTKAAMAGRLASLPRVTAALDKGAKIGQTMEKLDLAGQVMQKTGQGASAVLSGLGRKLQGHAFGAGKSSHLGNLPTERRRNVIEFTLRQGLQPTEKGLTRLEELGKDAGQAQEAAIKAASAGGLKINMDPIAVEAARQGFDSYSNIPIGYPTALERFNQYTQEALTHPKLGTRGNYTFWSPRYHRPKVSRPWGADWERLSPDAPPRGTARAAGAGGASEVTWKTSARPELPPANTLGPETPQFTMRSPEAEEWLNRKRLSGSVETPAGAQAEPQVTAEWIAAEGLPAGTPREIPMIEAPATPPSTPPYFSIPKENLHWTELKPVTRRVRLNGLTDPVQAHATISASGTVADRMGKFRHDPTIGHSVDFLGNYNRIGQNVLASQIPNYALPTARYSLIAPARTAAHNIVRGTEYADPDMVANIPLRGAAQTRILGSIAGMSGAPMAAATAGVIGSRISSAVPRVMSRSGIALYRLGNGTALRIPLEAEKIPYSIRGVSLGFSPANVDKGINTAKRLTRKAVLAPFKMPGQIAVTGKLGGGQIAPLSQPKPADVKDDELLKLLDN